MELEIEYLHATFQSSLDLVEKLVERQKLKERINYEEFSFNIYRNVYNMLKKIDEDLQHILKIKKYENENNYFWRGIDIRKVNRLNNLIFYFLIFKISFESLF